MLAEAIQRNKLKSAAKSLSKLARTNTSIRRVTQKLEKGQLPTKQDLKSIKGKEQDDVVLALTKAIGPDEAIKLLEMCDQSKHAAKLAGYNGDPDGPLPKWGEPGGVEDAMKKTPGQKKKAKVAACFD